MLNRAYSLLHVKAVDDERRVLTGMATTPEPDRMGDIIEPLGVTFKNPLPLLLFHDTKNPVGRVKFSKATKDGIAFEATIAQIDEPGILKDNLDHAWQLVKSGLVKAVSIGFRPLNDALDFMQDTGGIRWRETEVLELSLVTVPANAQALIATVKSIDGERLAALGLTPTRPTQPSGVSDITRAAKAARRDVRPMKKTIAERISGFEATRQAKAARLTEIQDAAGDEGRSKDDAEREEFDTLKTEIKSIDAELVDLRDMEKLAIAKAVPVKGDNPEDASRSRGNENVVRFGKQDLPAGIGFARAVKACVVARLDGKNMLTVAKEMYPSDERLHGHISHVMNMPNIVAQIKAAVPAGTTTQSDWASALVDPTNLAGEFIEYLRPATIIGKFGTGNIPSLRRVPFNVRMIEQTQGGNGYWVGQGAAKPLTAFGFAPVTLAFTKVAAISVITEELARFSSPSAESLVRDGLRDALVERIDRDFIDPAEAGTANIQPASITNGLTASTSAGPTADNARTDLANLVADFVAANQNVDGLVLIMPTTLALALSFQVNALGQVQFPGLSMSGGTINGIPVITTQYAANASGGGNLVIAVNAREIFLADDGQVTIDASRDASLQMLDNPTNNSATATPTTMVSMWQTNSIALRAERMINWSKRRATAVSYMDDVNWGSIGSP